MEIRSVRRHYRLGAGLFGQPVATVSGREAVGPVAHAAAVPGNTALPAITGTATDGQTLTSSNGTWSNSPTSYTRAWQRCDSAGANCVAISGATATTYLLTSTDVGKTIRVKVTATNASGSGNATSAATAVVVAAAPANTAVPTITGTAKDGQTLTSTTGTWTGTTPISYARQWRRCDTAGTSCVDISGATATTYVLGAGDVGSTIKVVVTASNTAGSTSATTAATATITAAAPTNSAVPTVSGTAKEGQMLTATTGTWTGSATITYAYQWQRCNTSGASCSAISGATSSTYRLTSTDVGTTTKAVVTATNSAGNASATSAATATITTGAPVNLTLPTVSGTTTAGQTLTTSNGTWAGTATITYTRQWKRCNSSGASCTSISGATGTTYTLVAADVGSTIRVTWTAANGVGSTGSDSTQTAIVAAQPPINTAAPTITGTAQDGQTLSSAIGTWTGSGIAYSRQWKRCDTAGANCTNISGATASTYTLTGTDIGSTIKVAVTATNSGGAASASSAATSQVVGVAPANTAPPTISGTARDGQTLTAANGSWTGSAPIAYTYQWQRCNTAGTGCVPIPQATTSTYVLTSTDAGRTIRVTVTATNVAGEVTATSTATPTVLANAPANSASPSITGDLQVEHPLTLSKGGWSGTKPIAYTYNWQRCTTAAPGTCLPIDDAHGVDYTLQADDLGTYIRVVVTATNGAGQTSSTSAAVGPIAAAGLTNVQPPQIDGQPREYRSLSSGRGQWSTAVDAVSWQWQRCEDTASTCVDIAGADDDNYDVEPADVGHRLRVVATATAGTIQATSASSLTATVISGSTAGPTLSLAGDLIANPTQWLTSAGYALTISASASADADGLEDLSASLDDQLLQRWNDLCDTASCSTAKSLTVDAAALSEGEHDVKVSVVDRDGNTVSETRTVLIDHGGPQPAEDLAVVVNTAGNDLTWTAGPDGDLDHYNVLRRALPSGTFTTVGQTTEPAFRDELPPAGVAVQYAVVAVDMAGHSSSQSTAVTVDPAQTEPVAPTNLSVGLDAGDWLLSWTASVSAMGYVVYEQSPDLEAPVAIAHVTETQYRAPAEDDPGEYGFEVRAVRSDGHLSAPTPLITHELRGDASDDAPTVELSGAPVDDPYSAVSGTVDLNVHSTGAAGVTGLQSTIDGEPAQNWTQSCTTPSCDFDATWTIDTTTLDDGEHDLRVVATDTRRRTSDSDLAITTNNNPPTPPTGVWLEQTTTGDFVVHWTGVDEDDPDDVVSYRVSDENDSWWATPGRDEPTDATVGDCDDGCTISVIAIDAAGAESTPATVTYQPSTIPTAPTLSANATPGAITLTWTNTGAAGYRVFRSDFGGQDYHLVSNDLLTGTSFTDTSVIPGTTYYYVVRAVTTDGMASPASNAVDVTVPHASTAPTIALSGTLADHQGQTLDPGIYHLTAHASEPATAIEFLEITVDGVSLARHDEPCASGVCELEDTIDLDTTDYDDGPHLVEVTASDARHETSVASFSVTTNNAPPEAIAELRARWTDATTVALSWKDPIDRDLGTYRIYRGTSANNLTIVDTTSAPATSYQDDGLPSGSGALWYAVQAVDAHGDTSPISSPAVATPGGAADQTVSGLSATPGPYSITLNWQSLTAADLAGYRIYRRAGEDGEYTLMASPAPAATSAVDDAVHPGEAVTYIIKTLDTTGNEGPAGAPVTASAEGMREESGASPMVIAASRFDVDDTPLGHDLWVGSDRFPDANWQLAPCGDPVGELSCRQRNNTTALAVSPSASEVAEVTATTDVFHIPFVTARDLRTGEGSLVCEWDQPPCVERYGYGRVGYTPRGTLIFNANDFGSGQYEFWEKKTDGSLERLFETDIVPDHYDIAATGESLVSGFVQTDFDPATGTLISCTWAVFAADGSVEQRHTEPFPCSSPSLTTDGTRVLKLDRAFGYPRAATSNFDGSDLRYVSPPGVAAVRCCAPSPDGQRTMYLGRSVSTDAQGYLVGPPINDRGTYFGAGIDFPAVGADTEQMTTVFATDLYTSDLDDGSTRRLQVDHAQPQFQDAGVPGPVYAQASDAISLSTDLARTTYARSTDTLSASASATGINSTVDELAFYVHGHRYAPTGTAQSATFHMSLSSLPEGRYDGHLGAAMTSGLERSLTRTIVVDNTSPALPGKAQVAPVAPGESSAEVSWKPIIDPRLADGRAGSGVAAVRYRFRHPNGTWTGWSTTTDNRFTADNAELGSALDIEATDAASNRRRIRLPLHQVEITYISGACHLSVSAKYDGIVPGLVAAFRIPQTRIKISGVLNCGDDVRQVLAQDMCLEVFLGGRWRRSLRNCFDMKKAKDGHRVTFSLNWICQRPSDGLTAFAIKGSHTVWTNMLNNSKKLMSDPSYAECPKEAGDRQPAEAAAWRQLAGPPSQAVRLLREDLGPPPTKLGWAAHHTIPKGVGGIGTSLMQSIGYRCHVYPNSAHNGIYLRQKGRSLANGSPGYDALPAHLRKRAQHWNYPDVYSLALNEWLGASSVLDLDGVCRGRVAAWVGLHKINNVLIGVGDLYGDPLATGFIPGIGSSPPN